MCETWWSTRSVSWKKETLETPLIVYGTIADSWQDNEPTKCLPEQATVQCASYSMDKSCKQMVWIGSTGGKPTRIPSYGVLKCTDDASQPSKQPLSDVDVYEIDDFDIGKRCNKNSIIAWLNNKLDIYHEGSQFYRQIVLFEESFPDGCDPRVNENGLSIKIYYKCASPSNRPAVKKGKTTWSKSQYADTNCDDFHPVRKWWGYCYFFNKKFVQYDSLDNICVECEKHLGEFEEDQPNSDSLRVKTKCRSYCYQNDTFKKCVGYFSGDPQHEFVSLTYQIQLTWNTTVHKMPEAQENCDLIALHKRCDPETYGSIAAVNCYYLQAINFKKATLTLVEQDNSNHGFASTNKSLT